jgi:type II secretory pathway pseudopilin PulG
MTTMKHMSAANRRRVHARRAGYRSARAGFTIIEVIVVAIILAAVGGMLMKMLFSQQQFYNGTTDLIQLRSQLRQAEAVIGSDLRGVSSVGSDINSMTDSSFDFRYTFGSSIVCLAPNSGSSQIILPPTTLDRKNTLTSWLSIPQQNDTAYIFDEGPLTGASSDDQWRPYTVSSVVATIGGCPSTSKFTTLLDATSPSYTLTIAGTTGSSTILAGAPIRFVRHGRYSLYKSPNDNLWYLGYCSATCSGTNDALAPIAGPFRSYAPTATPDTSGIRITYFDSTGASTAVTGQVSRISIVLRGQTRGYVNVNGLARGVNKDSVRMDIALRNRS